jgi:6-phosphogluconolactonase (cycloisomerase 2 family)
MVVGGQKSGELHVLSIDPKSGDLSSTFHKAKIAKPVCIVFAT